MIHIIGHRGAAGLALENTIPSFKKAIEVGVEAFEFDIHETKDGRFVLCHDDHLAGVSESDKFIRDLTFEELQRIPLYNGTHVPPLENVLDIARAHRKAVIIEIKALHSVEEFCTVLDAYKDVAMTVASFNRELLTELHSLRPDIRFYVAEGHRPIEVLQQAKAMGAAGVDLNFKLLNPLTYFLARRWQLELMVYTVNSTFIARFLTMIYPAIHICTDHPEYFLSSNKQRRQKNASNT